MKKWALLVLVACNLLHAASERMLEIAVPTATIFSRPHNSAPVLALVRKGQQFKITEETNSWYRIEFKGRDGWIFYSDVDFLGKSRVSTRPSSNANSNTGVISKNSSEPLNSVNLLRSQVRYHFLQKKTEQPIARLCLLIKY